MWPDLVPKKEVPRSIPRNWARLDGKSATGRRHAHGTLQAMTAITDGKATATARKARERELEKVVVAKEDLELVVSSLDRLKAPQTQIVVTS